MKSDPIIEYYGRVKDGVITLPKKLRKEVLSVFEGRRIKVTFQINRKRRSSNQLRYYWGCIVRDITIAIKQEDPETGWTNTMVHEVLKERFLPLVREWREYTNKETGETIREPMTTTKLTTVEEEMYHEYCRKFGSEFFGIDISLPGEQVEMFQNSTI